jgi:hypothetical protein
MNRPSLLKPAQHIQEFWLANSAECPGVRSTDKEVTFLLLSTGKEEKRRMRVYQRPYWELYDDFRRYFKELCPGKSPPAAAPFWSTAHLVCGGRPMLTLQAGQSNHALLDANDRAVTFRKGERVVRGYWLNRTGTADTADLPDDERFEFKEPWDEKWRDTGTWEEGSEARSWLSRSKNSVEVVVRADDVMVWDVEVEEAPALATRVHRQRGYPGWIDRQANGCHAGHAGRCLRRRC